MLNRKNFVMYLIIAGAIILAALALPDYLKLSEPKDAGQNYGETVKNWPVVPTGIDAATLETQSAIVSGVNISATPQISAKIWSFDIVLDTHSGSLDDDLLKTFYLEDDQGHKYYPAGWSGDVPGGHHRTGELKFNGTYPQPEIFKLTIRLSGGEKIFIWENKIELI